MIRLWVSGQRRPSSLYERLLSRAFGLGRGPELAGEVDVLLDQGDLLDAALVASLEAHTAQMRVLDRRLGASRVLPQAEEHSRVVSDLVRWAPLGRLRSTLAATGAEAAALAGWLALDLGRPAESWRLHGKARALAQEAGDPAVLAHVTAQQAYAALDVGNHARAVEQVAAAREVAGSRVPGVVRAWLAAAEAEARAAGGDRDGTSRLLDLAGRWLSADDLPPYLVLDETHLARWAGHSLARVGDRRAIEELEKALLAMDPQFARASAALHVDLAVAYAVSGDEAAVRHHAAHADRLSALTGSHRQRVRVRGLLLGAVGEQVQESD